MTLFAGKYEVEADPFQNGGLGLVYRARDTAARFGGPDDLVLKRLKPEVLADQEAVARFRREIGIGSLIEHPNVLRVLDSGFDDTGDWYVTEYAPGGNLKEFVSAGLVARDEALGLFRDVAAGLHALHSRNTVHRDLSPGNVLLMDDRWVISDFGLSASEEVISSFRTSTGMAAQGTPDFVAPEVLGGLGAATQLSDIYSFGKLIQFVMEGRWPRNSPAVVNPLRAVIQRATHSDPNHRYSSAQDVLADIEVGLAPPPTDDESRMARADRYAKGLRRGTPPEADAREIMLWLASLDPQDARSQNDLVAIFPAIDADTLRYFSNLDHAAYVLAVRNFCNAVEGKRGRLDFDKVDGVASALDRCDSAVSDSEVRFCAVRALAILGASHNRFATRRLTVQLLKGRTSADLELVSVSALRESREAAWVLEDCDFRDIRESLRHKLQDLLR